MKLFVQVRTNKINLKRKFGFFINKYEEKPTTYYMYEYHLNIYVHKTPTIDTCIFFYTK